MFFMLGISAEAKDVTVVIDPGHGGENLGAQWNGYVEKELTLTVAKAMKQELEQYDGIKVYMTREDDAELSLQERADYAEKVNADFVYSLHFNMSEYHTMYGTEIWVSAFGENHAKAYAFGEIYLEKMTGLGLYSRGIRTRLNKRDEDYYGIIRICSEYEIPSCILEHCFLDRPEDVGHYETEEHLTELGRLDATSVAQYFRLSSAKLGVDYSDYPVSEIEIPTQVVRPDLSPPENVTLQVVAVDEKEAELTVLMTGEDKDSGMLYYSYSLDGGESYSDLCMWDSDETSIEATISVPYEKPIKLKCKVYNGYDIDTETDIVTVSSIKDLSKEELVLEQKEKPLPDFSIQPMQEPDELVLLEEKQQEQSSLRFVVHILIFSLLCSVFLVLVLSKVIWKRRRKK